MSAHQLRDAGRGCDILHFCAHGTFDRDAPLLSSVQLLPKNARENISVIDVATLIGPAKLAVLSACFSGFGKILGSNDGYGFPHALLSVGVKAFVRSLWKTDDGAAMMFMYIFYREMLLQREEKVDCSSNVSIAQAFTTAQRQLRSMSRTNYESCIDNIICELQKCDSGVLKRVIRIKEQMWWLNFLKQERDPASFVDPFYWVAFVLTGDGFQCI